MVMFVTLYGFLIVVFGILFLIRPETFMQYIAFWRPEKRLRLAGIITIPFGIIFLIAAHECRWEGLIIVLGVLAILKGVLLLTLNADRITAYLDWWERRSEKLLRILKIIIVIFGLVIVYAA